MTKNRKKNKTGRRKEKRKEIKKTGDQSLRKKKSQRKKT
jgi:hypothetical protein